MDKSYLTQEILKSILVYDEETGVFLRKVNSRRRKNILINAGSKTVNGYIAIYIKGHSYTAHRLAWLYFYGEWPENDIDHINGNKSDNRISNLRDVPRSINSINRTKKTSPKNSGLPMGVRKRVDNLNKPFFSSIYLSGHKKWLGYFKTAEEAKIAYDNAKNTHISSILAKN